jgi:MoaA/NifB/PqqE/SkfB family radical SAM enzyme
MFILHTKYSKMRKIFLVTDYDCNNHCISCAKETEEKGRLTLDEILEKMDLIQPTKEDFIELSGGEPTLRNDFFEICKTIKSRHDTNLVVLSNGRKFKDKTFSQKAQDSGVDRVMTTFYHPQEKTHDQITQANGSFQETLTGLKNLEEIGMPISVKTIVLSQNYQDLPDFVNFAYDTFQTAWVSIHGLIMRGQADENKEQIIVKYSQAKPHIEAAIDQAIKRNKNLGVFIIPSCTIDPCYWQYLGVNWRQMSKEMIYISPEETVIGNMDVSQPSYCAGCLIGDDCSWAWESAWKEYTNMFGTGELNKITPDKLK